MLSGSSPQADPLAGIGPRSHDGPAAAIAGCRSLDRQNLGPPGSPSGTTGAPSHQGGASSASRFRKPQRSGRSLPRTAPSSSSGSARSLCLTPGRRQKRSALGLPGAESTDRVNLLAWIGATVDVRVSLGRAAPRARVLPGRRLLAVSSVVNVAARDCACCCAPRSRDLGVLGDWVRYDGGRRYRQMRACTAADRSRVDD